MSAGSPVDVLYDLAARVTETSLTEDEAARLVERGHGFGLRLANREACFSMGALAFTAGRATGMTFARLVMAAARQVGGQDRQSPWWWAVDLLVSATTHALVNVADQRRLRDAVSAVDAKTDVLRREVQRPFGRRRTEELTRVLLAAAKLYITPYEMNVDDLDLESGLRRWNIPRFLTVYGMPEERVTPMPGIVDVARRARGYLDEAIGLATGELLGKCLVAVVDAMELDPQDSDEARRQHLLREAARRLDLSTAPAEYWRTVLRRATGHPGRRHQLDGDLGSPEGLVNQLGAVAALEVMSLVLRARPGNEDFVPLWRESRRVARVLGPSYTWHLFRHVIHSFPADEVECASAASLVDLGDATRKIETSVAEGQMAAEAGAATLAHLAAHAPPDRTAMNAVEVARWLAPEFAAEYQPALDFLTVRLALRGGQVLAETGLPAKACALYLYAVDEAERFRDATLSTEMISEVLKFVGRIAPEAEGRQLAMWSAFITATTLLPGLPEGDAEGLAEYTRSVGVQLDRLLRDQDRSLRPLALHHHRVFKGFDVDTLLGEPGPRQPTDGLESLYRQLATSPFQPTAPSFFSESAPADMSLMCYASRQETSTDPADRLRRAFDAAFTRDLLSKATGGRYPFGTSVGDVSLLQEQLPQDTVFLSLYLGTTDRDPAKGMEDRAHLMIAAVTTENYEVVRRDLNAPGAVLKFTDGPENGRKAFLVHSLGFQIGDLREAVNADPLIGETTPDAAQALESAYNRFGPGPEQLGRWRAAGKTHLCFWPHGPLHYAPLHLLHKDGKPLADDWTVTTVPSGMMLMRPRTEPRTLRLTVVGTNDGGSTFGLDPQPEVEQHVRDVAAMTPHSTVLTGGDATPRRALAAAEQSTYLHIAAHGSNDVDAAWFQCLYLHADHHNDGRLFAHEIVRADLRGVELVALCACETALGRFDRNDNLRGLPAAFLAAGSSTVVGTLWPVTPEVATLFFTRLFGDLLTGTPKRTSFRNAQLAARAAFPAYCDWGAFTFIGDWR